MNLFAISFLNPWALLGLLSLPLIYFLLRLTPPRPHKQIFAPMMFLLQLQTQQKESHHTPYWLILLRLLLVACLILALSSPQYQLSPQKFNGEKSILLVVDNSWSSASSWHLIKQNVENWLEHAKTQARLVTLVETLQTQNTDFNLQQAKTALDRFATSQPQPIVNNIEVLLEKINTAKNTDFFNQFDTLVWFSDGLETSANKKLAQSLETIDIENYFFYSPQNLQLVKIENILHKQENLTVNLVRIGKTIQSGFVVAYDKQGAVVAQQAFNFADNETKTQVEFSQPIELRYEFFQLKLKINNETNQALNNHAGETYLLDRRHQRRKVAIVSGETSESTQPLLSPLYFLNRALQPFSQIETANIGNETEFETLLDRDLSVLIIADVGTFSQTAQNKITQWVENGGILVRFAGPRLAASEQQNLLPIKLRRATRNLASTLSWSQPQKLSPFSQTSPFFGIEVPDDVTISKQLLAEPSSFLPENIWARLQDGTPLVTASKNKQGQIVLFHISGDPDWSNLPLSGTFVEMLKRIVDLSYSTQTNTDKAEATLSPFLVLDGFANLISPSDSIRPLVIDKSGKAQISNDNLLFNPPGFYGDNESPLAFNLFDRENNPQEFLPLQKNNISQNWQLTPLENKQPIQFKTPLLLISFFLFLIDCLVVLFMAGILPKQIIAAKLSFVLLLSLPFATLDSFSQTNDNIDFTPSLETQLGYVKTGDAALDEISRKGLLGLTQFMAARTALEPAPPRAVNIENDELSFYPLLYWPITPRQQTPSPATMARLNQFMKQGGTVLFDSRDQNIASFWGEDGVSAATLKLREILSHLDIPPIEPVPNDHVLTRSFYLLDRFYGRYAGSPLWVEVVAQSENNQSDGVSSVLITSADFAGAWAIETSGNYTLPISPPNARQRTLAYRAGVNIVMYTLTGNYKLDQVHAPALLERLGQ